MNVIDFEDYFIALLVTVHTTVDGYLSLNGLVLYTVLLCHTMQCVISAPYCFLNWVHLPLPGGVMCSFYRDHCSCFTTGLFSGVRSGERFLAAIVRSNCELDGILLPSFGAYHNMILLFFDLSCFPRAKESWEGKKQKRSTGSPAHCTYGVLSPSSFFMYI